MKEDGAINAAIVSFTLHGSLLSLPCDMSIVLKVVARNPMLLPCPAVPFFVSPAMLNIHINTVCDRILAEEENKAYSIASCRYDAALFQYSLDFTVAPQSMRA